MLPAAFSSTKLSGFEISSVNFLTGSTISTTTAELIFDRKFFVMRPILGPCQARARSGVERGCVPGAAVRYPQRSGARQLQLCEKVLAALNVDAADVLKAAEHACGESDGARALAFGTGRRTVGRGIDAVPVVELLLGCNRLVSGVGVAGGRERDCRCRHLRAWWRPLL